MTRYVFVLGKNWMLGIAELIVYLQDRNLANEIYDYTRTTAVVDIEERLDDKELIDILGFLGGSFKIAKVVSVYDRSLVEEAFPAKGGVKKQARALLQQVPWTKGVWRNVKNKKVKFAVSTYSTSTKQTTIDLRKLTMGFDEWTKQQLMKMGARKAVYHIYEGPDKRGAERPNVALWPKSIARHGLLSPPNAEIILAIAESSVYVAKTIGVYDAELQRYRDESRPYISEEISTSPKLCRTLLNLAGARTGDTVLDPFCGSGTLLMEAALLGMNCIGVDIDGDAVNGANQNLRWLSRDLGEKKIFKIIKGDSQQIDKFVDSEVDAVAFEPELGPVYSERPTKEEASLQALELTKLYRGVLLGIGKVLRQEGRIAMTIPVINSQKGQVTIDLEEMTRGTEFGVIRLLPNEAFESSMPRSRQLAILPDRRTLPERKRGQVVERAVLMLGRF
ncbi:MAG: methyltransferase domain-containing protein [Candidatus Thorarchaeota archaeon]|nr:methyltransferase domain-containing protein [Candidatus Thorarchaeota archaeon]